MQMIPTSTQSSTSGNGSRAPSGARCRPRARRGRRAAGPGARWSCGDACPCCAGSLRRAAERILGVSAAQRSDRHRRALHRAPPGHRAAALPRRAGARRRRRRRRRRRARGGRCWWPRRCSACRSGARSRWRGCGSARRSTTAPDSNMLGIVVAFVGILVSLFVTLSLASRLDRVWRLVRRAAGHDQREGALARIFGATAVIALVLFGIWFLRDRGPGAVAGARADAAAVRLLPAVRRALAGRGLARAARAPRRGAPRGIRSSSRRWTSPAPPGTGRRTRRSINAATFALRRAVNAYPDDTRAAGGDRRRHTTSTRRAW